MGCGSSAPSDHAAGSAAPAAAEAPASAAADGDAAAPERVKRLITIHYNDVYNLEEGKREPVGGAARFAGMVFKQNDDPLVLFSGDALNPSMASTFFKVRLI